MTDPFWMSWPQNHPTHQDGLWAELRRLASDTIAPRMTPSPRSVSIGNEPPPAELLAVIKSAKREIAVVKVGGAPSDSTTRPPQDFAYYAGQPLPLRSDSE